MDKSKLKVLFLLHIMLMIYSMSGICSKLASGEKFLSPHFLSLLCNYNFIAWLLCNWLATDYQTIAPDNSFCK